MTKGLTVKPTGRVTAKVNVGVHAPCTSRMPEVSSPQAAISGTEPSLFVKEVAIPTVATALNVEYPAMDPELNVLRATVISTSKTVPEKDVVATMESLDEAVPLATIVTVAVVPVVKEMVEALSASPDATSLTTEVC